MHLRSPALVLFATAALALLIAGCGGDDHHGFENCGNGILDAGEQCDDGNLVDADTCLSTCELNVCGDGVLNTGVEQCDVGQLGSATCAGLGFAGGSLACTPQCTFDTTGCSGVGGSTPTPAATPSEGATSEGPTQSNATPTTAATPSGATCRAGDQIVVVASLDKSYGGAQIDLGYPSATVNIPGTGASPSVAERVKFTVADGLSVVSDHAQPGSAVDDTLTASVVSSSDHPAGPFVTVTFDCLEGAVPPIAAQFSCTASASTGTGDVISDVQCSVAVQ